MAYPGIFRARPTHDEAAQFDTTGHSSKRRTRLLFWIVSSFIILPLSAANIVWWSQEARIATRRKELQDLWPTVFRILEQADVVDLIALNPEGVRGEAEAFHGHGVLGRATIRNADDIRTLAAAFLRGRRQGGSAYLCFDPRHGIHVRHGDQDLDLVICFECTQGYLYFGRFQEFWFGISNSPRTSFDQVFEKAGLQIAK
jgi:hypothetical protein